MICHVLHVHTESTCQYNMSGKISQASISSEFRNAPTAAASGGTKACTPRRPAMGKPRRPGKRNLNPAPSHELQEAAGRERVETDRASSITCVPFKLEHGV
uniref:Uncharacterized protein n=1 Tax=Arundo donax TaxID=35708 RepID=A0A0A9C7L7_ARUDO